MKIDRILGILGYLANREKVTIQELAEKFEVSKRTIFRDLDTLNMAGFPIAAYPGYGGGVGLIAGHKLDISTLSVTDIRNIFIGLNSLKGLDKEKSVDHLIAKLIPKNEDIMQIESDIIVDLTSWTIPDGSQEMLGEFRKAIRNYQYIEIEYHAKSIYSKRTIEPYKLIFKYSFWYLYAFCMMRNDFRLFKFSRISSFIISDETFTPKVIDNLSSIFTYERVDNKYEDNEKEQVVLEYELKDKSFLMDKLGAQNFTERNGKGYIEFLSANPSWTADLIMSLQDKVKVITPKSLQHEVTQRISRMSELYTDKK